MKAPSLSITRRPPNIQISTRYAIRKNSTQPKLDVTAGVAPSSARGQQSYLAQGAITIGPRGAHIHVDRCPPSFPIKLAGGSHTRADTQTQLIHVLLQAYRWRSTRAGRPRARRSAAAAARSGAWWRGSRATAATAAVARAEPAERGAHWSRSRAQVRPAPPPSCWSRATGRPQPPAAAEAAGPMAPGASSSSASTGGPSATSLRDRPTASVEHTKHEVSPLPLCCTFHLRTFSLYLSLYLYLSVSLYSFSVPIYLSHYIILLYCLSLFIELFSRAT